MARKTKKQIEEEKYKKKLVSKITWIIVSILVFLLSVFAITKMGVFGLALNNIFVYLIGSLYIFALLTLLAYAIYSAFFIEKGRIGLKIGTGIILFNVMIIILSAFVSNNVNSFDELKSFIVDSFFKLISEDFFKFNGGIIGSFFYVLCNDLVNRTGTLIIIIVMFILSLVLIIPGKTYKDIYVDTKSRIKENKIEKEKIKQEKLAEKLRLEEERKLELAREYNASQDSDIDIKADEVEVVEVKPKKVDTYSTNSPFLINLTDSELRSNVVKDDSVIKSKNNTSSLHINHDNSDPDKQGRTIRKVVRNNGVYKLPKPYEEYLGKSTSNSNSVNKTSAAVKGSKVIEILKNFGINATLVNTYIGPSVTKFEIKPDSSVKVNKILNISDNIKMELAAKDIRIEAPIPGRSAVGIEIPNVEPNEVRMLDLIKQIPAEKKASQLLFCLGKDLMGKPVYCDIPKMPHLLIAGATGSGKSVCINSIITSILLRSNPDDVKLVLVDPKKVEFTPYKEIPHLLWPIIDDAQMASNMLKRIVVMMEDRYDAFSTVGVRNIQSFNEFVDEHNASLKTGESPMNKLPLICVIIDELADLMAIAGKEVELSIQRITQLARASGIHLIVATQRPSTDVITGLIKSNIPSRISFAVASSIDSRTILDQTGAERLLGNGDMLYYPQGENAPIRLQGVFVLDKEIQKITTFVKSQAKPEYEDSYFEFLTNMNGTTVMGASAVNADSMDSLYDDVVEYVTEAQKASTSLLQRRFGIGYNRAARLIDTLEDRGIIGPSNGSKPREVYRKLDDDEE